MVASLLSPHPPPRRAHPPSVPLYPTINSPLSCCCYTPLGSCCIETTTCATWRFGPSGRWCRRTWPPYSGIEGPSSNASRCSMCAVFVLEHVLLSLAAHAGGYMRKRDCGQRAEGARGWGQKSCGGVGCNSIFLLHFMMTRRTRRQRKGNLDLLCGRMYDGCSSCTRYVVCSQTTYAVRPALVASCVSCRFRSTVYLSMLGRPVSVLLRCWFVDVAFTCLLRRTKSRTRSVADDPPPLYAPLQDPDPSIRVRALDLIFQLVSRNNARALVAELLNYLVVAPSGQKRDTCSNILQVRDIHYIIGLRAEFPFLRARPASPRRCCQVFAVTQP